MANFIRVVVTIGNTYELTAHQRSKAAWIARGDFNNEPLEGQGRTPSRAAASWREQAVTKKELARITPPLAGHKRHDLPDVTR